MLAAEGINADVYSLRFAAPIDEEYLAALCRRYRHVITVEDGSVAGGVGESVAAILARTAEGPRVTILGFSSVPPAQATRDELLRDAGLDEAGIAAAVKKLAAASVGAGMRDALSVASGL
jgi:1-deoxy-D-xylulose-5-phosphate synthase